jgi:hypothetical protein
LGIYVIYWNSTITSPDSGETVAIIAIPAEYDITISEEEMLDALKATA